MRKRWWTSPQVRDGVLAVVLLAAGVFVSTSAELDNGTLVDTFLLPLVVAPLPLRHRAPLAAAAAFSAAVVVSALPTFGAYRCGVAVPVALMILFTLGVRAPRRDALFGLGLILAAMVFLGYTEELFDRDGAGFATFALPVCAGVWAGARLVRSRERLTRALEERSAEIERRREQTARLAVEIERTRVASELDVAARARVRGILELADEDRLPAEGARELFARIEQEGREALNELRGLLGVLRSDERAARAPRPTLAQLEALLAEARSGGRIVDLAVDGERRPLPGGVELAAYRTIQHALVAVRGGAAEPATVRLRYLAAALELEVSGRPVVGETAEAAVLAARERVTTHGGSFSAAATDPRTRVLRARLPVGAAVA